MIARASAGGWPGGNTWLSIIAMFVPLSSSTGVSAKFDSIAMSWMLEVHRWSHLLVPMRSTTLWRHTLYALPSSG